MNDRIRLAEAMGYERVDSKTFSTTRWIKPARSKAIQSYVIESDLPDPFTDANDCNDLVKYLNGLWWRININQELNGHSVKIWRFKSPDTRELVWEGDNYMQGVCELALKVLP